MKKEEAPANGSFLLVMSSGVGEDYSVLPLREKM